MWKLHRERLADVPTYVNSRRCHGRNSNCRIINSSLIREAGGLLLSKDPFKVGVGENVLSTRNVSGCHGNLSLHGY